MKQVLPEPPVQRFEIDGRINPPFKRRVVKSLPTSAADLAPQKPKFEIDDEDDVEVSDFGELTCSYLNP